MAINTDVKDGAIKLAEMLAILSRRLIEATDSGDMLRLQSELRELSMSLTVAGPVLLLGLITTDAAEQK